MSEDIKRWAVFWLWSLTCVAVGFLVAVVMFV